MIHLNNYTIKILFHIIHLNYYTHFTIEYYYMVLQNICAVTIEPHYNYFT